MYGGGEFMSFGVANKATKNKENKTDRGLGNCQTTNSTQQPTKNMQTRQRGNHTGRVT